MYYYPSVSEVTGACTCIRAYLVHGSNLHLFSLLLVKFDISVDLSSGGVSGACDGGGVLVCNTQLGSSSSSRGEILRL